MQVMHYCIATYAFVILQNIVMNKAIASFCDFCIGKHCYAIRCKNITMHKLAVLLDAIQLQQVT